MVTLTDKQHIKLVKVGDEFYENFSKLIAESVLQMPIEIEDIVVSYLQDLSSVYGSNYSQVLEQIRNDYINK